jgi:hypothetical protein
MQAERPRKVFGSKNRVNVETEPSQDDSKKQAEQSLPITKKEVKLVHFLSVSVHSFCTSELIIKLHFY